MKGRRKGINKMRNNKNNKLKNLLRSHKQRTNNNKTKMMNQPS